MPAYALESRCPNLPHPDRIFLAPGARVIGDVTLGDEVGVWFNAVLRGDNEPMVIGARTNIQDGCILHSDFGFPLRVGGGCTIGHKAILHGCTIGDGSLIGMGATVLNGAVIGHECLVGAGALVTEGKVFPDRSLIVGAPARLVRTLDEEAVERLRASADGYVANWRRFAAGLTSL